MSWHTLSLHDACPISGCARPRTAALFPDDDGETARLRWLRGRGRAMSQASGHILTVAEAARLLKVHPHTGRNLSKAGTIPAARVGRQWRFVEAELVAWIRSGYPGAARTQDRKSTRLNSSH